MKHHLFYVMAASFLLFSPLSHSSSNFDTSSQTLTIDKVNIDHSDTAVVNVKLKLNSAGRFEIVHYEQPNNTLNIAQTCTTAHVNVNNYHKLSVGMSLDEMQQTIGCKARVSSQSSTEAVYMFETTRLLDGSIMVHLVNGALETKFDMNLAN